MIVADLRNKTANDWNLNLLNQLFTQHDVDHILGISACEVNFCDQLIWNFEKICCYSVRSGYKLAFNFGMNPEEYVDPLPWIKMWTFKLLPVSKLWYRSCVMASCLSSIDCC